MNGLGCILERWLESSSVFNPNYNAATYIALLEEHFLTFVDDLFFDCTFQQDNASADSAHYIFEWFIENNINVLAWPARRLDLNPIENAWLGSLAGCTPMISSSILWIL